MLSTTYQRNLLPVYIYTNYKTMHSLDDDSHSIPSVTLLIRTTDYSVMSAEFKKKKASRLV